MSVISKRVAMWLLRRHRSRGQALVEFTIFVPVFLLLLLITVDFGRVFFSDIEINNAAREGASYAATNPTDTTGIQTHVVQETDAQSQRGAGTVTVPTVACQDSTGAAIACSAATGGTGSGNTVSVHVSEPFVFFTPLINGFFNNNFQIGASASAVVLGYAASTSATPPPGCAPPTSSFTVVVNNLTITADPSASRPNSGTCNISGYNWNWGDGTTDVGSASAQVHVYLAAAVYAVTLETTNQAGNTTSTQSVPVGSAPPPTCTVPVASFTSTTNANGKIRSFTDTSTVADPINCPITSWAWNFGDGPPSTGSNAQNPTFNYGDNKSHTVTLIATNSAGASAPYSHTQ